MVIIKVIPDIDSAFGSPIRELFRVWAEVERQKELQMVIDLSGCRFSNPFFLLGIYLFYRHCKEAGYQIELNADCKNNAFRAYLNLTYFRGGFKPDDHPVVEYNNILDSYRNKTYLPLTNFPSGQDAQASYIREKVLEFMGQRLRESLNLNTQLFTAVSYIISESVNNIRDHSGTERGFIFPQFYPRKDYMDLCIADSGVGLLGSYQAVGRSNITSHEEAMQAALSGDTSTDDPNRGFGLRTSRRMLVNGLKGSYFLLSGNAFAFSQPGAEDVIRTIPEQAGLTWPGTYLALRVPVQRNVNFNYVDYLE